MNRSATLPRVAVYLFALSTLVSSGVAQAASYLVTGIDDVATGSPASCTGAAPNFSCPTLRDAVAAANATPDDDEISSQSPFTLTITLVHGPLAIANNGSLAIDGNTLINTNIAISGNNASRVFVIEENAVATLRRLDVVNGSAAFPEGGGGIRTAGNLTLEYVTVSGNGAYGVGGIQNSGTLELRYSTVSGNSGNANGGISNSGTLNLRHSTVSGNTAFGIGGIGNTGTLSLAYSTVSANTGSQTSGGIATSEGGAIALTASAIAGNTGGDCKRLDGVIGASHSLIGDGLACLNGTNTANLGGDAKLAALGGNGGRTITHYPMPGSPLIDAVVCDLVPDTSQDQRGVTRPQGVRCDIGAVEADQIVVDTTADNTSADGLCSLREAIVNANSNGQTHTDCAPGSAYDIITFDPTVFANANASTIVLGALLPNIATDLLIDGTRADGGNVAISGNNARGVFVVLSSRSVSLRKLGIVKGRRSGNGGGIVNQGTLNIVHCTVSGNTATSLGGGIFNTGTLSIEHSTVSGNRAGDGGGIHSGGTLVIRHSTVTENISMEFGGGVCSSAGAGTTTIEQSTLSGNSAVLKGGAIHKHDNGPLNIAHSTLSDNSTRYGGGIHSEGGTLTIEHSTLSGNSAEQQGGGILNLGAATLVHSTLSGNLALQGGGIDNGGTLIVEHGTVSGNSANFGGGLYQTQGVTTLAASVFANSTGTGSDCSIAAGTINAAGSLIGSGLAGCVNGTNTGNLTGNPKLTALADHGGETHTHLPLPGSPLIDRISCVANPEFTDQRGIARPQGSSCDIGAVEVRQFALSVSMAGQGSVSADDIATPPSNGQVQGCRAAAGDCTAVYLEQAQVTLTATPDAGSHFVAWGGDCSGTATQASVTMDAARSCTASFAIDTHTVTPSVSGGHGAISPNAPQPIAHGETASFTLTPDDGYRIADMAGSCGGVLDGLVFATPPVLADCSVVASFARNPNTAPVMDILGNQAQPAGATGVFSVPRFASVVSFGSAPWEVEQSVLGYEIELLADPAELLFGTPTLALDGTLAYVLSGSSGSAQLRARVRDNGGTADGGVDTSDWHVFAITVGKGLDVGVSIPSAEPISNLCRFGDYTVLVENLGTVVANAVQVDIPLPDSLPSANWTCTPVGGATCPPSGSGPIEHSVNLPRNAGVIYRITGLFSPGPEPDDTFIAHAFISGDVFPDNDIATAAATACLFSDGYEGELE